jgi:hypothetical protein
MLVRMWEKELANTVYGIYTRVTTVEISKEVH